MGYTHTWFSVLVYQVASLGVPYQIDDASPFCRDSIVPPVIRSLSSLREMDMEEARNADSLLHDHLWVN